MSKGLQHLKYVLKYGDTTFVGTIEECVAIIVGQEVADGYSISRTENHDNG